MVILEMIILNEVCQKEKTNTMWYHLYVESELKHKGTYPQNRNVVTENRLVIAKGQSGWERESLGVCGLVGANYRICNGLSTRFYCSSTGNYIQYPVMNHN